MGSREVPSWDLGPVREEMGLSPEGVRVAGTLSQATDGVQLPDLTNNNTRHLVTIEFQRNKEYFSVSMPHVISGHTYTNNLFVAYLQFIFNWASCILSDNTWCVW